MALAPEGTGGHREAGVARGYAPHPSTSIHTMAHPEWTTAAQQLFLDAVRADLTRYAHLPLNAWERGALVHYVLVPRWASKGMPIPRDAIVRAAAKRCKEWVTKCKGTETVRPTSTLSSPIKEGGRDPYQLLWSF